ncbi:NAD-dependent methanol dehydrogenase [Halioglobus japonicus]|nr:NAD-dependent methanol dehydrogenase [Halioglobus japonicus]
MTAAHKKVWFRLRQTLLGSFITKPQPKPLVFVGPGSTKQLSQAIGRFGLRKILVVTDKPLRELGVLDPTLAALQDAGVETAVFEGVLPDPTEQVVDLGIDCYHREGCDSVLAFGGGSSIDAAKVIALGAANGCKTAACIGANKCKLPAVPFYAVPTTAGTGSEATFIAVISNNETHEKGPVIDPSLIPKAAALDPEIMRGLPTHITAATGMDALTHAIESYIGRWETDDTNYYGLSACRLIFENLPEACRNGSNLEAREAMALASHYGGLAITNALVGYVHAISHNLGAKYGVPHGLGNAMVLPHILELLKDDAADKLADIAVYCGMGERSEPNSALARKLIDRVWELNREIGIPASTDVIRDEDIEALVAAAITEGGSYPSPRFLSEDECRMVLRAIKA